MKKIFTFCMVLIATVSVAQVTIDESSFLRPASFTDIVLKGDITGVTFPSEGPGQIWDYSMLARIDSIVSEYYDATLDPNIQNALNYHERNLSFQGFPIPSNSYEGIDSLGWYELGRTTVGVKYSVSSITGMANDSLGFPAENQVFEGRNDQLIFPVSYQSSWQPQYNEYTEFELTVTNFGLNNAPGYLKRINNDSREVVGYGKLIIPKYDGSPSDSLDVLQIKVVRTAVDSFYLNGAEAPAMLLTAFGLSQGTSFSDSFYVFYKPNFVAPVLNINLSSSGQVSTVFYRPDGAESTISVPEIRSTASKCFPNPAAAGQTVQIQSTEELSKASRISIYDMQGRIIFNLPVENISDNNYQIKIPENIAPGLYMLNLETPKGNKISSSKINIQ
ncbi:MAG: T9SS type A sorting domain-containing protein [Bacteroidales bacterium]|nr:T9SS type A sorting domain-containing protein [Bacteroidales bacterium]MCF8458085.1 T9SS type A sorting domain-containing protein [Bacteroidales bacterium]